MSSPASSARRAWPSISLTWWKPFSGPKPKRTLREEADPGLRTFWVSLIYGSVTHIRVQLFGEASDHRGARLGQACPSPPLGLKGAGRSSGLIELVQLSHRLGREGEIEDLRVLQDP